MPQQLNFSNVEWWNALRAKYSTFRSMTSEGTADLFTERGFADISRDNINALNQFYELSIRTVFQKLDMAKIHTRLMDSGLVESYSIEMGGISQRISMEAIDPVSPAFENLQDGGTVDPHVISKYKGAKERFFQRNFSYQSGVTIQDFQAKQMFIGEYAMSTFLTGIMNGLELGYKKQLELNIYKVLHEAINREGIQDTQKIALTSWTDAGPTDAELKDFIAQLQDLATEMDVAITQPGFNEGKFDTAANKEDFVLLVRAGIVNRIKRNLMVGAYNPENLTIPFKIVEVADFGGNQYYFGDTDDYPLYPHYDSLGRVDGWAFSEGGAKEKERNDPSIRIVDTDANVLAVVAQKGVIFSEIQNPYSVIPVPNGRGLYTNYWASAPENGIVYDKCYDMILITKPAG